MSAWGHVAYWLGLRTDPPACRHGGISTIRLHSIILASGDLGFTWTCSRCQAHQHGTGIYPGDLKAWIEPSVTCLTCASRVSP